jgi:hypothetical protein
LIGNLLHEANKLIASYELHKIKRKIVTKFTPKTIPAESLEAKLAQIPKPPSAYIVDPRYLSSKDVLNLTTDIDNEMSYDTNAIGNTPQISSQGCSRVFIVKSKSFILYFFLVFFHTFHSHKLCVIVLLVISEFVRGKRLPSIFTFDRVILNKWLEDAKVISINVLKLFSFFIDIAFTVYYVSLVLFY